MATHNPIPAPAPTTARWVAPVISGTLTAAFAFLAFRLSFAALTALAVEHGVESDVVWMFAVLVDGGAVVGTVGVVMARRSGRSAWPYWATVVAFAAVSLAFNIAHSDGTTLGVAIAVTPPLAQLVATELLVRMLPADGDTATPAAVAPSVSAAVAAAERASAAARTVTAAVKDVSAAATVARTAADEATAAAATAAETAQQVSMGDTAAAAPLDELDLAALVAAVDDEPPPPAALDVAPPPRLPHSATFTAPPTAARLDEDDAAGDAVPPLADEVPPAWVEAYQKVQQQTGKRPTSERLGAALGLRRTRGGEIREAVEEILNHPCAVIVS